MKIPKIIHQIWGGEMDLPLSLSSLSDTWKEKQPDWKYEFWNDSRIYSFVKQNYSEYLPIFKDFKYNIQRWDSVRYLILYHYGGMYVDFDTECLEPLEPLLKDKECWFALEPEEHRKRINRPFYISSAIIGSVSKHFITKKIIERIFNTKILKEQSKNKTKDEICMHTTGPYALIDIYEELTFEEKKSVDLIPAKYLSPLSSEDTKKILDKHLSVLEESYLEEKIKDAYVIHYFLNDWLHGVNTFS